MDVSGRIESGTEIEDTEKYLSENNAESKPEFINLGVLCALCG